MNLKLNLKVLTEMFDDLNRVESQLHRVKDEEYRKKLDEEVKDLKTSAQKLFKHYKTVLESQV